MPAEIGYTLEDGTVVWFEFEPGPGFRPVGPEEIVGRLREALEPAVAGAAVVVDAVKASRPDEIEVKFGIKVSGTMNWLIAKAATEANFEVTLTWSPDKGDSVKEPYDAPALR